MTRRNSIRAALAASLLAAGLLLPAAVTQVAAGDAKGPPCADFIVGDGAGEGYVGTTVVVRNALAKVACPKVTYTLVVLAGDGSTELARLALAGDPTWNFNGLPVAQWSLEVPTQTESICYYMTSSSANGKVIDRAPDTDCVVVLQGTSPAGRGHN
jgi:hypothetical protein